MVNLIIDGKNLSVENGTTILDAAKSAGIEIPTLCYLKDISEVGACRICVVEIVGRDRLFASCNTVCEEGMEVLTDSPKVREARINNLKLLLSEHDKDCDNCVRNKNCRLQTLVEEYKIEENEFEKNLVLDRFSKTFPLIRDVNKCVKCMRCINVCENIQALGIWDLTGSGSRVNVGVKGGANLENSDCSLCGQCITHCPVGALHARDDTDKFLEAVKDKDKITVVQIAPAVRTGWGEEFGLSHEEATVNKLVTAFKKMGADYVFDTSFSADLTVMEEGSEFLSRLPDIKKTGLPMFTSCCPAWVRFIKAREPELADRLSSAKSPQQMFGAIAKTYYAEILGVSPEKIFSVSVMPCVAKKYERSVPLMSRDGIFDVDLVLTTREMNRLIKRANITPAELKETEFDSPLGTYTGAGVIFGKTGGVMEAALRSAYYLATGANPSVDAFKAVRNDGGWKEAEFDIKGTKLKVAVVSGLKNAEKLLEAIKNGAKFDFVEVMACPGGCVGGGGQPIFDGEERANERGKVLENLDESFTLRFSHENPAVIACYKDFLDSPMSEKAHHLLHTNQKEW